MIEQLKGKEGGNVRRRLRMRRRPAKVAIVSRMAGSRTRVSRGTSELIEATEAPALVGAAAEERGMESCTIAALKLPFTARVSPIFPGSLQVSMTP